MELGFTGRQSPSLCYNGDKGSTPTNIHSPKVRRSLIRTHTHTPSFVAVFAGLPFMRSCLFLEPDSCAVPWHLFVHPWEYLVRRRKQVNRPISAKIEGVSQLLLVVRWKDVGQLGAQTRKKANTCVSFTDVDGHYSGNIETCSTYSCQTRIERLAGDGWNPSCGHPWGGYIVQTGTPNLITSTHNKTTEEYMFPCNTNMDPENHWVN